MGISVLSVHPLVSPEGSQFVKHLLKHFGVRSSLVIYSFVFRLFLFLYLPFYFPWVYLVFLYMCTCLCNVCMSLLCWWIYCMGTPVWAHLCGQRKEAISYFLWSLLVNMELIDSSRLPPNEIWLSLFTLCHTPPPPTVVTDICPHAQLVHGCLARSNVLMFACQTFYRLGHLLSTSLIFSVRFFRLHIC